MKSFRPRVPTVLAFVAAVVAYLLFNLTEQLARQQLAESLADPAALDAALSRLDGQFYIFGIFAIAAAALGAWMLGHAIMRPFERVTADIAGSGEVVPHGALAESYALALAASRRDAESLTRASVLATSSSQLAQLVAAVSEGLLYMDDHGRVLQANPAAIRLLGMPQEVTQKHAISLIRNVEVRDVLTRAMSGESQSAVEVTVDDRHLLIDARPLPAHPHLAEDDVGASAGTVVSVTDLTDLRRLESVRRDFVANVSHELKTPLTSIHGYAETLRMDEDMPVETRRQFLEVIDRNAVRLQRIVDDLLDLSRLEAGVWVPDLQDVDVGQIARDVWTSCRDIGSARDIVFTAPEDGALVRADVEALRHILSNVITNAVRYTPPGGSITVSVSEPQPSPDGGDDRIRVIHVTDSGTGIPGSSLRRIFERFYRVDPARSREAGGTGLGLAIVKHLTESMDGRVSASSELGKGTTIGISLPAAPAA